MAIRQTLLDSYPALAGQDIPLDRSSHIYIGCWWCRQSHLSCSEFFWNQACTCLESKPKRIQNLTGLLPQIQVWDGIEPIAERGIVIQCTPLGQQGEDPLESHTLLPNQMCLILFITPNSFNSKASRIGGVAFDGGGMLVHQAAHSFARWFECSPPIESMTTTFTNIHITGVQYELFHSRRLQKRLL